MCFVVPTYDSDSVCIVILRNKNVFIIIKLLIRFFLGTPFRSSFGNEDLCTIAIRVLGRIALNQSFVFQHGEKEGVKNTNVQPGQFGNMGAEHTLRINAAPYTSRQFDHTISCVRTKVLFTAVLYEMCVAVARYWLLHTRLSSVLRVQYSRPKIALNEAGGVPRNKGKADAQPSKSSESFSHNVTGCRIRL